MTDRERRVVVTGLGIVSALGNNVADVETSLESATCGVSKIRNFNTSALKFTHGAQVKNFDACEATRHRSFQQMDRFSQMAVAAGWQAVADSGLGADLANYQTGVVLGTAAGGQITLDEGFQEIYGNGKSRLNPLTVAKFMPNAAASHLSMTFGVTGACYTVCTACSSSNHAIGQAFHMIRSGVLERAITGGSDCPFSWGHMCGWSSMRVVTGEYCRPFDVNRSGMVLGEGAGILVLELETAARARGAMIHAEVVGFGMSADAGHLVQPSTDGAAHAIGAALADGQVNPDSVSYINAHGTGTLANDAQETMAIRLALGAAADNVAVSSTKSAHGHGLGAAGALEAVVTCLATSKALIPSTINCENVDPKIDLDIVKGNARQKTVDVALSNSFAFGGLNAVLAFKRYR